MEPTPRTDVDAWADALLDQHRTMPRAEVRRMNEPAPLEDLPPMVKLSMSFGGAHPTRDQVERMQRAGRRAQTAAKWEGLFTLIGGAALLLFLLIFLSSF